jgi:hypothetical protein
MGLGITITRILHILSITSMSLLPLFLFSPSVGSSMSSKSLQAENDKTHDDNKYIGSKNDPSEGEQVNIVHHGAGSANHPVEKEVSTHTILFNSKNHETNRTKKQQN